MRFRSMLCVAALLIAAASIGVAQAPAIPDTPPGRLLRLWLDAFNSGDSAKIGAFARQYQPQLRTIDGTLRLRQTTGGADLVRILDSKPRHIEFLLRDKQSGSNARGSFDVPDAEPYVMNNFMIQGIPTGAPVERCTTFADSPSHTSAGVADPKDVATQDAIIAALYEAISGPACQHRDWDRFRSLFVAGARLIPTRLGPPPERKVSAVVESPDEYVNAVRTSLEQNGFFEREIASTIETFGSITHRFSTYESRRAANDDRPFARGINSIQLLNDGTRWWIVTVYWQGERPDNPIPAQFLKNP